MCSVGELGWLWEEQGCCLTTAPAFHRHPTAPQATPLYLATEVERSPALDKYRTDKVPFAFKQ